MNGLRRRKSSGRRVKKLLYLVCEGEKTEPIYFENFRTPECNFHIILSSSGRKNATGLVKEAIRKISAGSFDAAHGDQAWCVFDVDENDDDELKAALSLADENGISIALSNPCFEIWYLIHYSFCSSKISRQDLLVKLDGHISGYHKKLDVFSKLNGRLPSAVKNAQQLNEMHERAGVELISTRSNPSTQVFRVIETITKIKELNR